jgi:hypothetical protein
MRRLALLLLSLALVPAAFAQPKHSTHEHGAADLRVAIDGKALLIDFESPLDNLVGFEHAPRDQKQRNALANAEQTLARFDHLFELPAAAACTLQDVHLRSPWPEGDEQHKEHPRHEHGETHADMQATYHMECSQPQALKAMEVKLFDAFPQIHRIRAETATPHGQGSTSLSRSKRLLNL